MVSDTLTTIPARFTRSLDDRQKMPILRVIERPGQWPSQPKLIPGLILSPDIVKDSMMLLAYAFVGHGDVPSSERTDDTPDRLIACDSVA